MSQARRSGLFPKRIPFQRLLFNVHVYFVLVKMTLETWQFFLPKWHWRPLTSAFIVTHKASTTIMANHPLLEI